eukprot:c3566_g1_i1.p1 GENE.c3566_g1_i1~~c3566_g1_i1.p1  ORF type:complete len:210 (+),score=56.26 c3566_g1_i1:49-630(+)
MAHLYWRVYVTGSADTCWEAYLRRIELFDENNNPARGGVATHRFQEVDPSGRDANLAFDGNSDTMFKTCWDAGKSGEWVAYKHTEPIDVRRIEIHQFGNDGNYVSSIDLEYSDDGNTWYTIHSASGLPTSVYDSGVFTPIESPTVRVDKIPEATSEPVADAQAADAPIDTPADTPAEAPADTPAEAPAEAPAE